MRVALIGCGKQKSLRASAASEMYRSQLFCSALRYAIVACDQIFVLSAKHGLLASDTVIEPYDETLPRRASDRLLWGARVARQLDEAVPDLDAELVVLAGERYADAIIPEDRDWQWSEPLRGMGVGERLAWLKEARLLALRRTSPVLGLSADFADGTEQPLLRGLFTRRP